MSIHKGLDPEEIRRLYVVEGMTATAIAAEMGVSRQAIFHHLRKAGVKRRTHADYEKQVMAFDDCYEKRTDGCWIWTAGTSNGEYPGFSVEGKTVGAHRLMYERENGPIPAGLHIHHRCEVKMCVNPGHLELMTPTEHVLHHRPGQIRWAGAAAWSGTPAAT